jgi:hypothetical protein
MKDLLKKNKSISHLSNKADENSRFASKISQNLESMRLQITSVIKKHPTDVKVTFVGDRLLCWALQNCPADSLLICLR